MASKLITHNGGLHGLPPLVLLPIEILHEIAAHVSFECLKVSTHSKREYS